MSDIPREAVEALLAKYDTPASEDACGCYFVREHIERCAPVSEDAGLTASSLTYSDAATDNSDGPVLESDMPDPDVSHNGPINDTRLTEDEREALAQALDCHLHGAEYGPCGSCEEMAERVLDAGWVSPDRLAKVEAERDAYRRAAALLAEQVEKAEAVRAEAAAEALLSAAEDSRWSRDEHGHVRNWLRERAADLRKGDEA